LNQRGEYYKLTLMSPFFNPGPIEQPNIPIFIAGVNTGLARLAGETADGFDVHPFHSPRYLREFILPGIEQGATKAGRARAEIQVFVTAFVATTPAERAFCRQQIAFYASTPSYRPVMALHGWESTAEALSGLAGRGRWDEMPELIDDEMLETFALVGRPDQIPGALVARYLDLADRLSLYSPFLPGERDESWYSLIAAVREAS
jgi:probable F420-dependent oxidoreductase